MYNGKCKTSEKVKDYSHLPLNLYDTAGLSESAEGNIPTVEAFVQLIKLCYSIPNGIHLLIYCHPQGRISTEQFKANYRIFKEDLCESKIPCLLIVTFCDDDDNNPLNQWWVENRDTIRNKLKFEFVDGVCVTTKKNKRNDPATIRESYIISRRNLIQAIEEHARSRSMFINSWKRKVMVCMRKCYNYVADWIGIQQLSLRPELVKMFVDLKYSEEEAIRETEKLLGELEDKELMDPYRIVNVDDH